MIAACKRWWFRWRAWRLQREADRLIAESAMYRRDARLSIVNSIIFRQRAARARASAARVLARLIS